MKKIKIILLSFMLIALSISIAFSTFLFTNSKITININNSETTKYKITFTDNGSVVKTMFVDSDYNLSLKDAPYYFNSSGNPIKWYSNSVGIINAFDATISSNLDFQASSFSSSEIITENLQNGWPSSDNNMDKFNSNYSNYYVYNGNITLFYQANFWGEHDHLELDLLHMTNIVNGDQTIGLQASTNNCKYNLQLNRDIILMGNITVGGMTGFYGDDSNYSQISYQGFIIGDYCTLDLNGHDLIVGDPNDGAMLDVWGQVTDSSAEKEGTLVLDSSATMYAVMVVEDVYHEKRMPYTYYSNDNIFAMYRCPYWDCNTIINSGASVYGKYRIDLGGLGTDWIYGDIKLIGKTESLIIINNGYVKRTVGTNQTIKNLGGVYTNDWLYQMINYEAYDASITFNKFELPFEYSGFNADMDSTGYSFFISPYFDFQLYGCTLNLNQHLVFMPGSSLYIDSNSTLNISYQENKSMSSISASGITIPEKYWQASGGMTFLNEFYLMNSITTLFGTNASDNTEGYSCVIYQSRGDFWSNLEPAYGYLECKVNFISQTFHQYVPIEFGGRIYVKDVEKFRGYINNGLSKNLNIQLFSTTFKTDWCRIFGNSGTDKKYIYRDVTGYYTYPLVCNDYVIMDPTDTTGKSINNTDTTNRYKYDWDAKVIYNELTPSEGYAFIYTTNDLSNLYLCNNINGVDSLAGYYQRIPTIDRNNKKIVYNSTEYILFNGAYIPKNGTGYLVSKFIDNTIYASTLTWSFSYTNGAWKPSSAV